MSRVERHKNEYSAAESCSSTDSAARFFGKLISVIGAVIMITVIIFGLGMTVPGLFGIEQYVVISGSMEPAIPVGSIVYASDADPAQLEAGDVIVFYGNSGSTPVTHRVVENRVQDGEVITKGDANEQADLAPIAYRNIIGKVIFHLPVLGHAAAIFSSLAGKIGVLLVVAGAYLLTALGAKLRQHYM